MVSDNNTNTIVKRDPRTCFQAKYTKPQYGSLNQSQQIYSLLLAKIGKKKKKPASLYIYITKTLKEYAAKTNVTPQTTKSLKLCITLSEISESFITTVGSL